MPFYTPLRYPGGKRRLAPFVMRLLEANDLHDIEYVEPYAGGASLGLALLFEEYAATIHINDLSRPVYAFWHSVLNDTDVLCRRIEKVPLTMKEWKRQRAVYEGREDADLLDLGVAAFFLNRTNRSGIINGGVIGGQSQTGEWGIDARFNKAELIQRIRRVGRYRNRIRLYQQDALDFTNDVVTTLAGRVFSFYDPPYIAKGQDLYLNTYTVEDHRRLAEGIVKLKHPWVVTYDYVAAVQHDLYPRQPRIAFELSYSAQERHGGREVMFLSERLTLPPPWNTGDAISMSAAKSRYAVFGRMEGMNKRSSEALKKVTSAIQEDAPPPSKKPARKRTPPTAPA